MAERSKKRFLFSHRHDCTCESDPIGRCVVHRETWQREFFRLAAVWLACRADLVAGAADPIWRFLGEMDYAAEMQLLIDERKPRRT